MYSSAVRTIAIRRLFAVRNPCLGSSCFLIPSASTHQMCFSPYRKSLINFSSVAHSKKIRIPIQTKLNYFSTYSVSEAQTDPGSSNFTSVQQNLPFWVKTPIDLEIYKAENPQDLLAVCQKYSLSHSQMSSLLWRLGSLGGQNYFASSNLRNSVSGPGFFQSLHKIFTDTYADTFLPSGEVVMAMKSLLFLGMHPSDPVLANLRNRLMQFLNKVNGDSLASFAAFHSSYAAITREAQEFQLRLERRLCWVLTNEVISVENLLLLMTKLPFEAGGAVHSEWQTAIEKQAGVIYTQMSWSQCCRMIQMLADMNNRNVGLIQCVMEQLVNSATQEDITLPLKTIVMVLSSANKLNVFFPGLFGKVFTDLEKQLLSSWEHVKLQIISSLLVSMGQMRIRDGPVLELLCKWMQEHIVKNKQTGKVQDMVPVVLTMAKCNFVPQKTSESFLEEIVQMLNKKKFFEEFDHQLDKDSDKEVEMHRRNEIWLDVIWSLAALNGLNEDLVKDVLCDQDFYTPLIEQSNPKAMINKFKLLNIKTAYELDLNCSFEELEHCFPCDITALNAEVLGAKAVASKSVTGADLLSAVVNHIAPKGTHSSMQFISPEGYTINSEFLLQATGRPVAIKDWDKVISESSAKKHAVILLGFTDFVTDSNGSMGLTGHATMSVRHLEKRGYAVVEVTENEFKRCQKYLDKLEYVKRKIGITDEM